MHSLDTRPPPVWCVLTKHPKWRFKVVTRLTLNTTVLGCNLEVRATSTGARLATLDPEGLLTIYPGYHFDGATMAPDLVVLMRAVVFHDLMCQCAGHPLWPFRRSDGDWWFMEVAAEDKHELLGAVYFLGIRLYYVFWRSRVRRPDSGVLVLDITPAHEHGIPDSKPQPQPDLS